MQLQQPPPFTWELPINWSRQMQMQAVDLMTAGRSDDWIAAQLQLDPVQGPTTIAQLRNALTQRAKAPVSSLMV